MHQSRPSAAKPTVEALGLLDSAVEALRNARKEWEAISKASPTMARTSNCEAWWRADVKNMLRACIAANIAIGTLKKVVTGLGKETAMKNKLKVEISNGEGSQNKTIYHAFWIVPKITALG